LIDKTLSIGLLVVNNLFVDLFVDQLIRLKTEGTSGVPAEDRRFFAQLRRSQAGCRAEADPQQATPDEAPDDRIQADPEIVQKLIVYQDVGERIDYRQRRRKEHRFYQIGSGYRIPDQ
jgi:hypothetical protein